MKTRSLKVLLAILLLPVFAQAQDEKNSFSYIWSNYQTQPEEIRLLRPEHFNFGELRNAWATAAVIRSNFIVKDVEAARYFYDKHLKENLPIYKDKHLGTYIEVVSVEALLYRKEFRYEESDSVYNKIIATKDLLVTDDLVNEVGGQIALAYFHKAGLKKMLAQKDSAEAYFDLALQWAEKVQRDDIKHDALTNYSLFEISTMKNFDKAEQLQAQAKAMDMKYAKADILQNMVQASILAHKEHEFEQALDVLKQTRTTARASQEWELWENMASMIMSIEVDQERYEAHITYRFFGFLGFLLVSFFGYLNYRLIYERNKKLAKEPVEYHEKRIVGMFGNKR